jgi:hypothetical protein
MDLSEVAQSRIDFLHVDLDLAKTFVDLAEVELGLENREHSRKLIEKAQVALDTVRRLIGTKPSIAADEAEKLAVRCEELESSISRVMRGQAL